MVSIANLEFTYEGEEGALGKHSHVTLSLKGAGPAPRPFLLHTTGVHKCNYKAINKFHILNNEI